MQPSQSSIRMTRSIFKLAKNKKRAILKVVVFFNCLIITGGDYDEKDFGKDFRGIPIRGVPGLLMFMMAIFAILYLVDRKGMKAFFDYEEETEW